MGDEILKFPSKKLDVNTEQTWKIMVDAIQRDFSAVGFSQYAEEFKTLFRPIFNSFALDPLEVPLFPESGYEIWKNSVDNLVKTMQEHNAKLLHERYLREIELFCESRILKE